LLVVGLLAIAELLAVVVELLTVARLLAIVGTVRNKHDVLLLIVVINRNRLLIISTALDNRKGNGRSAESRFGGGRGMALLSWAILLLSRRSLLSLLRRPLRLLGSRELGSLRAVVDGRGLKDRLLLLGVDDGDGIRKSLLGAALALGIGAPHDLDLNTKDTLSEKDVAGSAVNEVERGLTGVDHEAVGELHGLGTSSAELTRDDNLTTLGTRLHDEAEDTIAGTADGETVEKLVSEGLALSDGGKTTVLDLGGVEGDGVLGELESLLDEGGELADAAALLTENLLSVGSSDDDVGDGGCDADFDAGVALLGKLTLEELVELGVEDAVSDELPALGTVIRKNIHSQ